MDALLISAATGADEAAAALALAWKSFSGRTQGANGTDYKERLWRSDPTYAPDNIIVARTTNREVIAVVRLVPRVVCRGEQTFPTAGISSVCVDEAHRGAGVSAAVMEATLAIARERGYQLAFLFARRALDRYYPKFGFHGIAAHSRLRVEAPSMPIATANVTLTPSRWRDPSLYARAYEHSYAGCFGRVERSSAYWSFVRQKLKLLAGTSMLDIVVDGAACGYAIVGDGLVHELAVTDGFAGGSAASLLCALASADSRAVELCIPPQHALVPLMSGLDMTGVLRECVYGGHMGVVLDPDAVLAKFTSRVERHLAALRAGPLRRDVGRIHLTWDGECCRAQLDPGALSYDDTSTLLGAARQSPSPLDLDAVLPLNISLPDQF